MTIYWINVPQVHLGIMARPRGNDWLDDDLRILKQSGLDVIVSALTAAESEELGLVGEADACAQNGLVFVSFPIEDRAQPEHPGQFEELVDQILKYLKNGRSVAVHCRAGIGRSSLIVASALTRMDLTTDQAFQLVVQARGRPVPDTPEQRNWVETYSESSRR